MKASEISLRTAPPHTIELGPGAWATMWEGRPSQPITVGIRRLSAFDRASANTQAIARTDRAFEKMPERRVARDALWRQTWEIWFCHLLIGMALCHPQDVTRPMWPDQDGDLALQHVADRDGVPYVSRRFSDAGIVRVLDEIEELERRSGVNKRRARDGEILALGAELADGSLLAALRAASGDDAHAVEEHLRILLGQALDLLERGREAPHYTAA